MARRSARILEKERKYQLPLMELPREVRDMIYEACLVFDGAIFVKDKRRGCIGSTFKPREREEYFDRGMASIESSATAQGRKLFYVAQQIRDEAASMFYRKNTFEFTSLTEMEKFILEMGLSSQHILRSVIVYYEAAYMAYTRPLTLLTQCVGLRELTLVLCDKCVSYSNKHIAIGGYRYAPAELKVPALGTLLKIRGLNNVRLVMSSNAARITSPLDRGYTMLQALEDAIQVTRKPGPVPPPPKPRKAKKRAQKKRKSAPPSQQ